MAGSSPKKRTVSNFLALGDQRGGEGLEEPSPGEEDGRRSGQDLEEDLEAREKFPTSRGIQFYL
jgi:hypothetical protein